MRLPHIGLIYFLLLFPIFSFAQNQDNGLTHLDYYLEGVRYYNEREYPKAIESLKKALVENPENDAAFYYLGLSYIQKQDIQLGEVFLERAISIDPSNYWYNERMATLYHETQRYDKAIKLYEQLSSDYPNKTSLLYDLISIYSETNQYDKALKVLDKVEVLKGKNEMTEEVRYEFLLRNGNYPLAIKAIEEYLQKYPSPKAAYILGDLNKIMLKDSVAITYFKMALDMDPTYSLANLGIAESSYNLRDMPTYFENINIFLKDTRINIEHKKGYVKRAIPILARSYEPQLDEMVKTFVDTHPTDTGAIFTAGAYFFQTGKSDLGVEMFQMGANAHPDDYQINMEYITVLYYSKLWDKLIVQINRLLEHFPNATNLEEILSIAYWQSGDIDGAIAQYNKIINSLNKKDPALKHYYSSLGDLYHEKGDSNKAYYYYEKALKIDPKYNAVLNNYAYYLSLEKKKLKKAKKMSKITILSEPDNPTYLDTYAWILYELGEYTEAKEHIKRAMVYGGREQAALLDHYAEILFALKEYDLAFIYWEEANKKDPTLGTEEKIKSMKQLIKR